MRILEIRRHTMRAKPGVHLSQAGIELARTVGKDLGKFDYVACSDKERSAETAVALGCAVNETVSGLGTISETLAQQSGWPDSIDSIALRVEKNPDLYRFSDEQYRIWKAVLESCKTSQRTLIISHGAIMELGLLAATREMSIGQYGAVFGYCEGFRLAFESDECVGYEPIRLPAQLQLISNQ
ncbi:MAG: histidine phosphatase family protein [Maritimibacter sp.]